MASVTLSQAYRKLEAHAMAKYSTGKITKSAFDRALNAIRTYSAATTAKPPPKRKRRG